MTKVMYPLKSGFARPNFEPGRSTYKLERSHMLSIHLGTALAENDLYELDCQVVLLGLPSHGCDE